MILLLVKRIKLKRSKNNFSKVLEYKAIFVQPQNLLLTKSFFFTLFFYFYLFIYIFIYLFTYLFIYLFVFAL